MRQVPRYLIIGNGRVARHFKQYFSLLNIAYESWHRPQSVSDLYAILPSITHVLILIRDDAIEPFIVQHLFESNKIVVHFSGSLVTDKAYGAHPLMTFSDTLYDLSQYQAIPFILDHDAPALAVLLPGLANQHARLDKTLKPKYHALCVLSGNFSCMLWQHLFTKLVTEMQIPAELAQPYLLQITQNLLVQPSAALTGPLVRGDRKTLQRNISALTADPFQSVFESFVKCYDNIKKEELSNEYL